MKTPKILTLVLVSLFAVGAAFADDKPASAEAKPANCCANAAKDGKDCTHGCCVEAAKAGKNCEKCGGSGAAAAKK